MMTRKQKREILGYLFMLAAFGVLSDHSLTSDVIRAYLFLVLIWIGIFVRFARSDREVEDVATLHVSTILRSKGGTEFGKRRVEED